MDYDAKPRMVFIVRKDLGMGRGKIAAQVAHAASRLTLQAHNENPELLAEYFDWGEPKIVLYVPDENSQNEIQQQFTEDGLINNLVVDAGKTQIEPNTQTVLGVLAAKRSIDPYTQALKLVN